MVTLSGDRATALTVVHPLSKGACGDDPSRTEEIKENGSEGNFPIHPDEVKVTFAGGHATALTVIHTLL
jgi:hypothetical protein